MKRYLPTPVNQLMADAMFGRTSRREIIKRGTALGLSSAVMGTILTAERLGAQGTPAATPGATPGASPVATGPAGYTIVVPEGLPDLAGATVNAMLSADGPGAAFDQACCDKFAEATGATVNYLKGAESATDRLTFLSQTFAAQSADVDVAMIDVIWPGIMAPHAVDLTDMKDELGVDFFERIVQNNTVDGKLVGIPWFTDAGLLYYRTDLLEKHGFSAPPQTWTELTEQAQAIIEGEAATNPSFTGFVFQAAAYEGLTCNALEWQFSYGGGTIIDEEGNVTVNNDQTKAALELARSWVGTIAPQAVTGYMEEDARGVWQGGNSAFMRNWPGSYVLGQEPGSAIRDKFNVAQLPMGEGEGASHAATLGGWQMMVSQYSPSVDAAKQFAKYMTSPELQKSRAIERSTLPTIGNLYSDQDVLAANPFFGELLEVFQTGSVARPSTASVDLYGEVSTAYFTRVNEILTGSAEIDAGLEDLQGQLEDIMADL